MEIVRLDIDLADRRLAFHRRDGHRAAMDMPADMFDQPTNIDRVTVDVLACQLVVAMPGEPAAVVELRRPRTTLAAQRAGRPVVYLDQNHWSAVAAARHGHRPVREAERQAALRLADMVEAGDLLLPASAGHLVETTPLHGPPRVALAGTVLALSRGWQMRNPLHVRVEEVVRIVRDDDPDAAEVFAPAADEFFAGLPEPVGAPPERAALAGGPASAQPGVPEELALLEEMLGSVPSVLGTFDAVIDEQAIEDPGGVAEAAAGGWAAGLADLAAQLRKADASASMVRRVAGARMLADMTDDLLRAAQLVGTTPEAVINRLTERDDPVALAPFLGQMRQMLFARLRNEGPWEANDLIDIMYLCCAAGYADVVVGERRAIANMRQGRLPPPRARLAVSLFEALEMLD